MPDRSVGRYGDGSYVARYPEWHTEDAPWKAAQVADLLRVHGLDGTRVCDIGCGTGMVLTELWRIGAIAGGVGFEPAPDARFVDDVPPSIELRRDPATVTGESFDVALMLDVFEHVPDYLGFLDELRGLAPWFVFHIPLDLNVYNLVRPSRFERLRHESGHLHYFDRNTALATLEQCGYEPVAHRFTPAFDAPVVESAGRTAHLMATMRRWGSRVSPSLTSTALGGLPLLVLARPR